MLRYVWLCLWLALLPSGVLAQEETGERGHVKVQSEDLASRAAANWTSYNGDYSGRRYSGLSQINLQNVNQLRAEWVFHSRTSDRMEVTPTGLVFYQQKKDGECVVHVQAAGSFHSCEILSAIDGGPTHAIPLIGPDE